MKIVIPVVHAWDMPSEEFCSARISFEVEISCFKLSNRVGRKFPKMIWITKSRAWKDLVQETCDEVILSFFGFTVGILLNGTLVK